MLWIIKFNFEPLVIMVFICTICFVIIWLASLRNWISFHSKPLSLLDLDKHSPILHGQITVEWCLYYTLVWNHSYAYHNTSHLEIHFDLCSHILWLTIRGIIWRGDQRLSVFKLSLCYSLSCQNNLLKIRKAHPVSYFFTWKWKTWEGRMFTFLDLSH